MFDVDVKEDAPPLKLPYNANGILFSRRFIRLIIILTHSSENPYNAAQRFLQNNDLPLSYLDEVVRFIEKNTAGVKVGSSPEFQDPFTGTST